MLWKTTCKMTKATHNVINYDLTWGQIYITSSMNPKVDLNGYFSLHIFFSIIIIFDSTDIYVEDFWDVCGKGRNWMR